MAWIHCGLYVLLRFPSAWANFTSLPNISSARDQFYSFTPQSLPDETRGSFSSHGSRLFCFSFWQFAENTPVFLCFWWPWKALLLCSRERASEHFYFLPHREAETVKLSASSVCTFPGADTVQSEIEIWPQGFANDAFSLSMAHAHSWGVTELAFIVPHFSSE